LKYLKIILLIYLGLFLVTNQKDQGFFFASTNDLRCLADNAWNEARGEGIKGMQAVIEVTINRKYSRQFSGSICKVVWQSKQFSWTNHYKNKKKPYKVTWDKSYEDALYLSRKALEGSLNPLLPESVLWYHHVKVKPIWRLSMRSEGTIGKHRFYSE